MCFLPAVGAELGVGEGVVLCREARCKVAGMVAGMVVKCVIPNGKTFEAVSRNSALLALLFDPVIPRVTPSPTQSSVRCLSVLLLPAQSPPLTPYSHSWLAQKCVQKYKCSLSRQSVAPGPGEAEIGGSVTPPLLTLSSVRNEVQTIGFNHILFAVFPPQPYTGADYS